jgi:hypothetical protein
MLSGGFSPENVDFRCEIRHSVADLVQFALLPMREVPEHPLRPLHPLLDLLSGV